MMSTSLVPTSAMNMAEWEKQGHGRGQESYEGTANETDSPEWSIGNSPSNQTPGALDPSLEPYNVAVMQDAADQIVPYPMFEARRDRDQQYLSSDKREARKSHSPLKQEDFSDDDEKKPAAVTRTPPQRSNRHPHTDSHHRQFAGFHQYYDSDPIPLENTTADSRAWSPEPAYPEPRFPPPAPSHHHFHPLGGNPMHHQQQHQYHQPPHQPHHSPSHPNPHHHPPPHGYGMMRHAPDPPAPIPSPIREQPRPAPPAVPRPARRPAANQRVPTQEELAQASTPRAIQALQTWYVRFNELIEYNDMYGDCNVPQKYEPNPQLGIWVNKQRMERKFMDEGKRSSMTESKVRNLETVGFKWAKRKGQISWDLKYRELCDFHRLHRHCDVPTKYKDNQALGRWVSTQRSEYKKFLEGRSKHMTDEKVAMLGRLNFKWEMLSTTPSRAGSASDSE